MGKLLQPGALRDTHRPSLGCGDRPQHRPEAYPNAEAFHPTFLYESLWNVGLAFLIIWLGKRFPQLRGRLIGVYFLGYGLMRFLLELIRTDTVFRFLGLSRNGWVSIGVMVLGVVILLWRRSPVSDERVASSESIPDL